MPGGFESDVTVRTRDLRVGAIGAGMIMADVHLEAYRQAGFPRRRHRVADGVERPLAGRERYDIPTVHASPLELIADPNVDIVDIAFPPDKQPDAHSRRARAGARAGASSPRSHSR